MWLVASGDRRVSVWNGDWKRDMCCLLDWLTFPGPSVAPDGTKLKKGDKVHVPAVMQVVICVSMISLFVVLHYILASMCTIHWPASSNA